ncbi:hypothetical protein [Parabacteroides sp. PF5-9]|uniref:hypothetical protein n=1 Tax=Parabacteroides sp. PF5-9 TaxID=1742404 RepID=UPI0024741AC1|nr:hypothetical protein [Parabacteroides sp. PF5-9]MDH6358692.1 hypothetical protein [Parabacteroides sp. PF5-9]
MKKWSKYIYYILAALVLASCTKEEGPDDPIVNPPTTGEEEITTIQIKFPSSSEALTKAINENGIDSLEILVFTPYSSGTTGSTADLFAYRISKKGGEITTVDANTKKVTASLKRNKQQRLILLANVPTATVTWLNNNLTEGVTKLSDILPNLTYSGSPWGTDHATKGQTSFPMWGQESNHTTILSTGTPSPKTIQMIRSVAKISVKPDETDPLLGFGTLYTLDSIYICNAVPNGFMTPVAAELGYTQVTKPNQNTTGSRSDLGYVRNDSIYVPECDSARVGNVASFIVIKAKFDDGGGLKPYYYKIDLKGDGKSVPLLRNHTYSILIRRILTRGYATLEEAKKADAPNSGVSYTITVGEVTTNVDEARIDNIVYSELYMLGTEAKGIKLDWMQYTAGAPYKLPVLTSYSGGWTASVIEGSSWLKLGTNTNKGVANQINYIHLETNNENFGLDSRKAIIEIVSGSLSLQVEIVQIIGSNSYVIASGSSAGTVTIPINSANLGNTGVGRISSATTGLKVKILWQEGDNVTLSVPTSTYNGIGTFAVTKAGTGTSANAVIGLVKPGGGPGMVGGIAGDELIWSWHVWVTSNAPTINSNLKTYNGYLFMDRNIGAASAAGTNLLYYQWGRKDPFFNNGSKQYYTVEETPDQDNLETAIKNPMVFYKATNTRYDWAGTVQRTNLWVDSGEKGAYDPCPFGWRMPIVDGYSSFANSKNGIVIPLAGGLDRNTGALVNTSTGYIWTATAGAGMQGQGFSFASSAASAVAISGSAVYRASAYPARCVRDVKR